MADGSFPEELFRMWMESNARRKEPPTDSDPARYPRAVLVEDDEAILAETKVQMAGAACREAAAALEVREAELAAEKARLFQRLERVYPAIPPTGRGGTGTRRFEGRLYYVSWDGTARDEPS